jgi:hypothetical protein
MNDFFLLNFFEKLPKIIKNVSKKLKYRIISYVNHLFTKTKSRNLKFLS